MEERAMRESSAGQAHTELKDLIVEASQALARLDGARLNELAQSCEALNKDIEPMGTEEKRELARQAREAKADMAVFARVLEATRSNIKVMQRLRDLRAGRLEYSESCARAGCSGVGTETRHGDH